MSQIFDKIQEVLIQIKPDVDKFYEKGNKAAGTRVRKAMQEIKALAQEMRKEIQAKKV